MNHFIITLVFCFVFSTNLFAQTNLLRELLDLPAPPPVTRPTSNAEPKPPRPADFFSKNKVPADDAPIEDLLEYWAVQSRTGQLGYKPPISEASLKRIMEAIEDAPEMLPNFLALFGDKTEHGEFVRSLYDGNAEAEKIPDNWRDRVRGWLTYNTKFAVDKLIGEAQRVKDIERDTQNEAALMALARVDWDSAAPILERLAMDKTQPFSAVSAVWVQYEHSLKEKDSSDAEKYRSQLKAIVADKTAAPGVRDKAMDALVLTEHWEGREEWYLSLLEDETLLAMQDKGFTGLTTLMSRSPPGEWAEAMLKLIGNKNPAIHTAAVRNLVSMLDKDGKEIIVALLPWLSNPNWAKPSRNSERNRILSVVATMDVPEAVPHLIWMLTNDEEHKMQAARALIRYKSPEAVPALRGALQNEPDEGDRMVFIEALIASGGITIDEQLAALEFYAAFTVSPEGKAWMEKLESRYRAGGTADEPAPLPVSTSIGRFLAFTTEPDDALVMQVIERRKALQKTKPEIAQILAEALKRWQGRAADLFRLSEIKSGTADADIILKILTARKNLRERVPAELASLRGASGIPGGIAACVSENEMELASAFRSDNAETRTATLACARLLRAPLPVAEVGAFLKGENKLLGLAAERYLETEDSPQARELIWAARKGEAFILGARRYFNPAKQRDYNPALSEFFQSVNSMYFGADGADETLDKEEEKLRREVLEDAELLMVYAYRNHNIRVYKDRAVYANYDDEARYWERNLSKEEYAAFQKLIQDANLGSQSPAFDCERAKDNCVPSQFLMLNRNGGRRVYAYSDFLRGFGGLAKLFSEFAQTEGKLRYELEKYVSGLQVVVADRRFTVITVWKNADDLRVLVLDKIKEQEKEEEMSRLEKTEDDPDEAIDYKERSQKRWQRRAERAFENYSWRKINADGKIGETIAEPDAIPFLKSNLEIPPSRSMQQNDAPWQMRSGDYQIRLGLSYEGSGGLWKVNRAGSVKINDGTYHSPVVAAAGRWLVAAKANEEKGLDELVRVDLTTGKEYKTNQPLDEVLHPIAYIAAHNRVLVIRGKQNYDYRRMENQKTKADEYFLIDAATGATEPVKGEFRPLEQQTVRPLQPTSKPNEFWAAINEEKTANIGIYNTKTFTFKPLLKIPAIRLASMDVWVDETAGKIYFVYAGANERDGHLLSLPLPK